MKLLLYSKERVRNRFVFIEEFAFSSSCDPHITKSLVQIDCLSCFESIESDDHIINSAVMLLNNLPFDLLQSSRSRNLKGKIKKV